MRYMTETLHKLATRLYTNQGTGDVNYSRKSGRLQGILDGLPDTPENAAYLEKTISRMQKELDVRP